MPSTYTREKVLNAHANSHLHRLQLGPSQRAILK